MADAVLDVMEVGGGASHCMVERIGDMTEPGLVLDVQCAGSSLPVYVVGYSLQAALETKPLGVNER